MEKKMTRVEAMDYAIEAVETYFDGQEVKDEIIAALNAEIEAKIKKAEKAKERAAKKRAEGDALYDAIVEFLKANPDNYYDREAIVAELEEEYADITPQKVTARLTKAVKAEVVVKDTIEKHYGEEEKKKKVTGYKIA